VHNQNQKYNSYSVDDFIDDEYFQKWVLGEDDEVNSFWNNWIKENPEKQEIINDAYSFTLSLKFATNLKNEASENTSDIQKIIESYNKADAVPNTNRKFVIPRSLYLVAASISLLIVCLFIYQNHLFTNENQNVVATDFGKNKEVVLEDSTIINLNGNSEVTKNGFRRVELEEGEYHFNVTKKIDSAKFVINTKNSILTVLGTSFTVYERDDSLAVHLETGKLSIKLKDNTNDTTVFYILPGDLFTYNSNNNKVNIENNNFTNYSSWINGDYIFEQKSIKEIVNILRKTYGIDVEVNPALNNKVVTGKIPTHDMVLMLRIIANAVDGHLVVVGDKYLIKK